MTTPERTPVSEEKKQDDYKQQLGKFANEHWPKTKEKATLDRLIKFYIAHALQRFEMKSFYPLDGDIQEKAHYMDQAVAAIGAYDTVALLLKLRAIDETAAEEAARDIWLAADAGDSYSEWLWQWAIENDVPVDPQTLSGKTQEQHKAEWLRQEHLDNHREGHMDVCRRILTGLPEVALGEDPKVLLAIVNGNSDLQEDEIKNGLNGLLNAGELEVFEKDDERLAKWVKS